MRISLRARGDDVKDEEEGYGVNRWERVKLEIVWEMRWFMLG